MTSTLVSVSWWVGTDIRTSINTKVPSPIGGQQRRASMLTAVFDGGAAGQAAIQCRCPIRSFYHECQRFATRHTKATRRRWPDAAPGCHATGDSRQWHCPHMEMSPVGRSRVGHPTVFHWSPTRFSRPRAWMSLRILAWRGNSPPTASSSASIPIKISILLPPSL